MFCLMSASISLYIAFVIKLRGTSLIGAYVAILVTAGYITWKTSDTVRKSIEAGKNCIFMNNLKDFLECESGPSAKDGGKVTQGADLIERVERVRVPVGERLGDIEFDHVNFSYEGASSSVINDLSLSIKRGERIALVGENGAGKTTLIKLLMGLYSVSSGSIRVNGRDIGLYENESYRARYGTVFQDLQIFSLPLGENVLLRTPETEEDRLLVIDSLKKAQFGDKLAELPLGIDTPVTKEFDERGFVCSGGQAQKIAIARVFAKRPDIVILDEPSSALDPIAEYNMYDNMMKASEGRTVFFISHRLSSARIADRVFYLENGHVEEFGTHDELIDRGGKYAAMFELQAQNYREESWQTVEGNALYGK
jgi:ATP-binding cassette subfamily B protein